MSRAWRWILAAGTLITVAVFVTIWLMFQHIPGWYRPVAISPDDLQRVRDDLLGTFDVLGEWLVNVEEPFTHRFTQDQINAWLAARQDMWPGAGDWLPRGLADPFVRIDAQGFRLAATYRSRGIQAIVSARFVARADEQGVFLQLVEISGGSLSIPKSWIRDDLAALDAGHWPAGRRVGSQLDDRPLPALSGLLDGVILPNGWIWENGKQPFRIVALQFEPGVMRVTFDPLER